MSDVVNTEQDCFNDTLPLTCERGPTGKDVLLRVVNVGGVVSVAVFYALILGIGIFFGFKQKRQQRRNGSVSSAGGKYQQQTETIILAGRNIGLFVGILTMTGN